ncbi:TPA: RNA 2',3'-cyclic phosphodiesterase [Candidatus Kaiserbacteria bacterium]|nr:MAG: 2'-5' RNA ligase [Parcubacteria group bacterium GW2011_GWA1_56_13]KKW46914.1 MAG: 2'-5' RNA ligase [Parcubacteria group bacterium GW2011_GWB1_57_6]HCR52615.1 RNA 2',3'-cyclic phosphodiesterase [Candidatus Kaiserbacteria bacterium]
MKETKKPPRRVFVGIKMPDEVARALVKLQARLGGLPVKLIPKEDLHLTLAPPWQETMVIRASQNLRKLLANVPMFTLTLRTLSYGPDRWRPRLVWATCSDTEPVVAFKKKLLKAFGVREHVPFTPHVTVARFELQDETAPLRIPLDIPLDISLSVERVQMFESPHEGGSGYKVLYDFHLSFDGLPH